MINLDKLNNIHSELQNESDLQNLVDHYKNALNIITNISNNCNEINKLRLNINKTSNLLYKISKQLNIQFEKFDIQDINYYFTEFLERRTELITKTNRTLKKIDFKNITPEKFIKQHYDKLYLNDSIQGNYTKTTMSILKVDIDENKKDRFFEDFHTYTAHHFNNENNFNVYAFKNYYYSIEENVIYQQMNTKEFNTIINEIHKTYPTFKNDLYDVLNKYFSLIKFLNRDVKDYQDELKNIQTILEIYI